MTVKQLYEYAIAHNAENAKITIEYVCDDDYYNYEGELTEEQIEKITKKKNKKKLNILIGG